MKVFNRTYLKLLTICISFTLVFGFFCNIMVSRILESNMKLVCDVYYKQISSKVINDIMLLKSANEYLAKNEVIIEYIRNPDQKIKHSEEEKEAILKEIQNIEKVLETVSFVDSINIIDLRNKILFSKGLEISFFDITNRPWYKEEIFTVSSKESQLTKKHLDYTTGKSTMSIVTLIYKDKEHIPQNIIGAAVLDVYIDELLNYIDSSFYSGVLKTEIYGTDFDVSKLEDYKDDYNIYVNQDILNNGEYLVFKFDKASLIEDEMVRDSLTQMKFVIWTIAIIISILLFASIRMFFRAALMSIDKLKSILEKLNKDSYFVGEKNNEFRQLEILADTLNKSFDDKIQELIYYDELTELPNRKMLENICTKNIQMKKPFALLFIDLNKFKYINDVFGHTVGDEFLIKFSKKMKSCIKDDGILTRYSGDEFIIVYEKYIDKKSLLEFYNQEIKKVFLKPVKINSMLETEISFSAGVAIYPEDATDFEDLINKSDFMMYVNKKRFKDNQLAFFNEEIYSELLETEKIKLELKYALDKEEFYLNYQPIVDKDKNILKAEALIRWNSKELGFIAPDKFIKYLEETRQIIDVGYWIIETVCKTIKNFESIGKKVEISVNISPVQWMLKDFVLRTKEIVERYNVDYNLLCFEITETVLLEEKSHVSNNIEEIKRLGINISLDDFGTGYSSFNYLRIYNFDVLKIDKSFLRNLEETDLKIINQIKSLAHILKMKVVIEGIETQEQFDKMIGMGIDYIQGYYFSKPLLEEEFKNKLMEG